MPLFGRELTYTRSDDQITILAHPEEKKAMALTIDGDSLSGGGLVFEKE